MVLSSRTDRSTAKHSIGFDDTNAKKDTLDVDTKKD